jgi:hypothetical protein
MQATNAGECLLEATEAWYPYRVKSGGATLDSNELALAGLARCQRLLWGMLQLHDGGSDLAGSFGRTLYETWLNAVYVLFAGDEAHERLVANDQHERRRLAKALLDWPDELREHVPGLLERAEAQLAEPDPTIGKLSLRDVALAVRRATAEAGEPDSDWYQKAYTVLYGPESYMSVHGGLESMRRQVDLETGVISSEGWVYQGADRRLEVVIAMVAVLASQLASRLGLAHSALDALGQAWKPEMGD